MNRLSIEKRTQILQALVEGNSIRGTCRLTGAAKGTVLKLLYDAGQVCETYQAKMFRNLRCPRIQADEIWTFCGAKQFNLPKETQEDPTQGDVWTWVGMDADTKLIPAWYVGNRELESALEFTRILASRVHTPCQITTDGHGPYIDAMEQAFGSEADFAMLRKEYGCKQGKTSRKHCTGVRRMILQGQPDPDHISTSYVERQNGRMRTDMRRFARRTNGFSRKLENLRAAVALHFMNYNFCRVHATVKQTPAMAIGLACVPMPLDFIVYLLKKQEKA